MDNQNTEKSLQTEPEASPSVSETSEDLLKKFRKELLKTGVFVFAGVIALVLGAIAWFVSNNRVQSGTGSVSARHEEVKIASKGLRQDAEKQLLKLADGTAYQYKEETYYYTENGEIALYLSEDYVVSPGATGTVDFFVIPTHDGAMTVNLYIGLSGYEEKNIDGKTQVERIEDSALDALLSGHILLFNEYENGHYSGWISNGGTDGILNNTITITLPEDTKEGVPYPVKIYWIWPLRYENMVLDLYEAGSTEYEKRFHPFVEDQAKTENMSSLSETSSYKYSRIFLTKETTLNDKDSRTRAYNLADEYIGSNVDYLYLTIKTAGYEG